MYIHYHLFLCSIVLKLTCALSGSGVCQTKDDSVNNLIDVCCADFEEKESRCKPCPPGYTSSIGQLCRPCPANTYGKTCLQECNCNDFQRCDKEVGCINGITPEASTDADHTSSFLSDGKTARFSNREVIVYYTLSLAVLILLVCLCSVFIKYKRRKTRQTVDISIPRNESVNQIIDNHEHIEVANINVYDEIDEAEMVVVYLKPEVLKNDYLEVVHVPGSSRTSSTKSNKSVQNGYLNPYQPCVSTNDTRSSYEKLKMETVRNPLIKRTSCGSDNLLSMGTVCSNKLHDIWIPTKSLQRYMQTIHREWIADKERKLLNSEERLSFSSVDLKKNMHSSLSLSAKYKTF